MLQTFLIIILAAGLAWFLVRVLPRRGKAGVRASRQKTPENRYSAVSITPCPNACQGAIAVKGTRFLSREAPLLPLAGCAAPKCHCVYHHHTDRRTGNGDRRAIGSGGGRILAQACGNRRERAGRRETDNGNLSWT